MSEPVGDAITEEAVIELHKQFRLQWEQAQDCFVLLYPEGMIKLPGSSGEIMKRIDGKSRVSEIIADLEATFPGADLRQDVIDFLGAAHANGWIRQQDH
jgi:pyrroloquinoline quinone biosynthesis protein D